MLFLIRKNNFISHNCDVTVYFVIATLFLAVVTLNLTIVT